MFLADKADTTVVAIAGEGLVWDGWHSVPVSLPVPFVLEGGIVGILKGGEKIDGDETPVVTVLS